MPHSTSLNTCELMFWSESDPPTVTLRFHSELIDHLVTIPVLFLQVNHLNPQTGHIENEKMVVMVRDGKVVPHDLDKPSEED